MKVAVIGNRDLTDSEWINKQLSTHIPLTNIVVLLGGAKGAQEYTKQWCESNHIDYIVIPPAHMIDKVLVKHFSPRMFFMRNKHIIEQADRVLFLRKDTEDGEVDRAMEYAVRVKSGLFQVLDYT